MATERAKLRTGRDADAAGLLWDAQGRSLDATGGAVDAYGRRFGAHGAHMEPTWSAHAEIEKSAPAAQIKKKFKKNACSNSGVPQVPACPT